MTGQKKRFVRSAIGKKTSIFGLLCRSIKNKAALYRGKVANFRPIAGLAILSYENNMFFDQQNARNLSIGYEAEFFYI